MKDIDIRFYELVYTEEGYPAYRLREQISERVEDSSEFTTYDSSHGHCALCGSLSCNGSCFK